jgi:hypothetical protein
LAKGLRGERGSYNAPAKSTFKCATEGIFEMDLKGIGYDGVHWVI